MRPVPRQLRCRARGRRAFLGLLVAAMSTAGRRIAASEEEAAAFETEVLKGRVVFLAQALDRKFGIKSSPDALERVLAVETGRGELVPLVEDVRGRAFRADKRLRQMDLELTVRRYAGSPAVQVIRVCELATDGKYEVDYWCEVCSIVMFELKECECCQAPNELRKRKVDK